MLESGEMEGVFLAYSFKRGVCFFITESLVILWFIKIDLKQICCSYSRTHKIENDFL